jgi:hypothetical protein
MIGCGITITIVFGLCSVLLASILSGKTRKKYFWGYRKNLCARILNGFVSLQKNQNDTLNVCFLIEGFIYNISFNNFMAWDCLFDIYSIIWSFLCVFCHM